MAATVSQAFKDAENAPTRHPRGKLYMVLKNVAHKAQGSAVVEGASNDYNTNFPGAGIIDGDATHINFGRAAAGADSEWPGGADNGVGLSGWKSKSAAASAAVTSAAELAATLLPSAGVVGAEVQVTTGENRLTRSEDFSHADWVKTNITATADTSAAPDETTTGDTLTATAANALAMQDRSALSGVTYDGIWASLRFSVWLRRKTGTGDVKLSLDNGVTETTATLTTRWQRFSVQQTRAVTVVGKCAIRIVTSGDEVYAWGACLRGVIFGTVDDGGYAKTEGTLVEHGLDIDFDSYAENTSLVSQGWTNFSLTGQPTANSLAAAAFGGSGLGVHLTADDAMPAERTDYHKWISTTTNARCTISFRVKHVQVGDSGASTFIEIKDFDVGAGTSAWSIRLDETGAVLCLLPGTGQVLNDVGAITTLGVWHRFVVMIDYNGGDYDVWMDGVQIAHREGATSGTVQALALTISAAVGVASNIWDVDDLRCTYGDAATSGTLRYTLDAGATPSALAGTLAFNGEATLVETWIGAGQYGVQNNDTNAALRDAAGQTLQAQTIAPAAGLLDVVYLNLKKVGSPTDNVWVELRTTSAGVPTSTILARSQSVPCLNLTTSYQKIRFAFPYPWQLDGTTTYALVVRGDFAVSAANFLHIASDASAPGYAGGQQYRFDGTAWNAVAADLCFALSTSTQEETGYSTANQDADLLVDIEHFASQGFKVPLDYTGRVHALICVKATGTPLNRLWAEIHTDDGAGKPSNVRVARSHMYTAESRVTWTAYRLYCISFPRNVALVASTQYHLVIYSDAPVDASNKWTLGVDNSSASYADGQRCASVQAAQGTPVWTATSTSDMVFSLRADHRPFVRWEAAYSDDDLTYTAYAKITDNPTRAGSPATVSFTGQAKRYWRVRGTLARVTSGGTDGPWNPTLTDLTPKITYATAQQITVTFGQARTIDRVELYAHPVQGGLRKFKLQKSTDGAAYSDITEVDTATLESRGRGVIGTATWVSPSVTITADHCEVTFSSSQVMNYLRVVVQDSNDEWARLLEVKAFRVVEAMSRVTAMQDSADADFDLMRIKAAALSLTLRNDDAELSSLNAAGSFFGQLGGGVKLIPYVGFDGVTDLLKLGVFYVDDWSESMDGAYDQPVVRVTARDGVKLMTTDVSPKYRTGQRHHEVVEYLGNLAGIPSQDMSLDRATGIVDFLVSPQIDAWDECQKIAEAASLAQCYFSRAGQLTFRITGTTSANTRLEAEDSTFQRTYGPPAFLDGKAYVLVAFASGGGNEQLKLCRYDLSTDDWTVLTAGFDTVGASPHAEAVAVEWEGSIYVFTNPNTSGTNGLKVYKWDGASGMLLIFHGTNATYDYIGATAAENALATAPTLVDPDSAWAMLCDPAPGGSAYFFDFNTFMPHRGSTGIDRIGGAAIEGTLPLAVADVGFTGGSAGMWLAGSDTSGDADLVIGSWDPFELELWSQFAAGARALTNTGAKEHATLADQVVDYFALGIAGTGDGHVFVVAGDSRVYKVAVPSGAVVSISEQANKDANVAGETGQFRDKQVVLHANGSVYAGMFVRKDGKLERRCLLYDSDLNEIVDAVAFTLSNTRVHGWASTTLAGVPVGIGCGDELRMFVVRIGRRLPAQTTSVFTISDATGGSFLGARVEAGDDRAGESKVVNTAVVLSRPLQQEASETLWTGQNLPWGVVNGRRMKVPVGLKKLAVPPQTLSVSYTDGGAGTAAISSHPKQPVVTIDLTGTGKISDISVSGTPLVNRQTMVGAVVGSAASLDRHGPRVETIENDYITDTMAQHLVAASLVLRRQNMRVRVSGVRARAHWWLERFDRLTLVESKRLKINDDFHLVRWTRDYVAQTMGLEVEQSPG